jgi:hypothetical protein
MFKVVNFRTRTLCLWVKIIGDFSSGLSRSLYSRGRLIRTNESKQ